MLVWPQRTPFLHPFSIKFGNFLLTALSLLWTASHSTQAVLILNTSSVRRQTGKQARVSASDRITKKEILTDRLSLAKAAGRQRKEREKVSQEARWQLLR